MSSPPPSPPSPPSAPPPAPPPAHSLSFSSVSSSSSSSVSIHPSLSEFDLPSMAGEEFEASSKWRNFPLRFPTLCFDERIGSCGWYGSASERDEERTAGRESDSYFCEPPDCKLLQRAQDRLLGWKKKRAEGGGERSYRDPRKLDTTALPYFPASSSTLHSASSNFAVAKHHDYGQTMDTFETVTSMCVDEDGSQLDESVYSTMSPPLTPQITSPLLETSLSHEEVLLEPSSPLTSSPLYSHRSISFSPAQWSSHSTSLLAQSGGHDHGQNDVERNRETESSTSDITYTRTNSIPGRSHVLPLEELKQMELYPPPRGAAPVYGLSSKDDYLLNTPTQSGFLRKKDPRSEHQDLADAKTYAQQELNSDFDSGVTDSLSEEKMADRQAFQKKLEMEKLQQEQCTETILKLELLPQNRLVTGDDVPDRGHLLPSPPPCILFACGFTSGEISEVKAIASLVSTYRRFEGYDVVSLCLVPCFFALDPDRPDGIRVTAQPIERIREIQRSLQALVDQVEFSCPVKIFVFEDLEKIFVGSLLQFHVELSPLVFERWRDDVRLIPATPSLSDMDEIAVQDTGELNLSSSYVDPIRVHFLLTQELVKLENGWNEVGLVAVADTSSRPLAPTNTATPVLYTNFVIRHLSSFPSPFIPLQAFRSRLFQQENRSRSRSLDSKSSNISATSSDTSASDALSSRVSSLDYSGEEEVPISPWRARICFLDIKGSESGSSLFKLLCHDKIHTEQGWTIGQLETIFDNRDVLLHSVASSVHSVSDFSQFSDMWKNFCCSEGIESLNPNMLIITFRHDDDEEFDPGSKKTMKHINSLKYSFPDSHFMLLGIINEDSESFSEIDKGVCEATAKILDAQYLDVHLGENVNREDSRQNLLMKILTNLFCFFEKEAIAEDGIRPIADPAMASSSLKGSGTGGRDIYFVDSGESYFEESTIDPVALSKHVKAHFEESTVDPVALSKHVKAHEHIRPTEEPSSSEPQRTSSVSEYGCDLISWDMIHVDNNISGRKVRLGRFLGRAVILKSFSKNHPEEETEFYREANVLSRLRRGDIVILTGIIEDAPDFHILVLEYVTGKDLRHWLNSSIVDSDISRCLSALEVARNIAMAMIYVHSKGIVHCDLKPENIARLSKDGTHHQIMIIDFGNASTVEDLDSVRLQRDSIQDEFLVDRSLGTPGYQCPDAINERISNKVDVYSFGVMLNEFLSGEQPFQGRESITKLYLPTIGERPNLFRDVWRTKIPDYEETLSPKVVDGLEMLITSCWNQDPSLRPTFIPITEILESLLQQLKEFVMD